MRVLRWSLVSACLGVGAASAAGELITFRFEGVVSSNLLVSGVWSGPRVGDPFYVEYTFETVTPDEDPSRFRGFYDNAIVSFRLGAGTVMESGVGDSIEVIDHAIDRYVAAMPLLRHRAQVVLQASGLHAITSDALPEAIDLDSWVVRDFIIQASGTGDGALIGSVQRFSVVPGASSAAGMFAPLMLTARRRRRC